MPTCWYAEECPFSHECTEASWDRCRRCASYEGEAGSRKLLFTHLTKSSHHYGHTIEEIEEAVADAIILTCEVADEEPAPAHEPLPATVAQAAALPANEYDDTNRVARDLTLVLQLRRRFAEPALSNDDEGIGTLVQLGGRRPAILRLGDQALNHLIRRHVYSRWHCFPQSAMHVS